MLCTTTMAIEWKPENNNSNHRVQIEKSFFIAECHVPPTTTTTECMRCAVTISENANFIIFVIFELQTLSSFEFVWIRLGRCCQQQTASPFTIFIRLTCSAQVSRFHATAHTIIEDILRCRWNDGSMFNTHANECDQFRFEIVNNIRYSKLSWHAERWLTKFHVICASTCRYSYGSDRTLNKNLRQHDIETK